MAEKPYAPSPAFWTTVDVAPSQRSTGMQRLRFLALLTLQHVLPALVMIGLSRATLMEGLRPFAPAFCAAALVSDISPVGVLIGAILGGYFTPEAYISPWIHVLSCMILGSAYIPIKLWFRKMPPLWVVGIASASSIIFAELIFGNRFLYDILLMLLTAVAAGISVPVFATALRMRGGRSHLAQEEILSCALLVSVLLLGMQNIMFGPVSPANALSAWLTLMVALASGTGIGACTGLLLGTMLALGNGNMVLAGTLGLCGLLAGVCRPLGRLGSVIAFWAGNALMGVYAGGFMLVISPWDLAIASTLALAVPSPWMHLIMQRVNMQQRSNSQTENDVKHMRKQMQRSLHTFSELFSCMGASFEQSARKKQDDRAGQVDGMVNQAAGVVCCDCGLRMRCWKKERERVESSLHVLASYAIDHGDIAASDVTEVMKRNCLRPDSMAKCLSDQAAMDMVQRRWQSKTAQCRVMIGQQLSGIGQIVGDISEGFLQDVHIQAEATDSLRAELDRVGIRFQSCSVVQVGDRFEAYIKAPRADALTTERAITHALSRRMHVQLEDGEWHATQAQLWDVQAACAQKPLRDPPCGDSVVMRSLPDGRTLLAISDGMGSGERAAQESSTTLNLLESFLCAGFDARDILRVVNQLMMLRAPEETFSTIDLCLIDPTNSQAEFMKIGASFSCHQSARDCRIIRSTSLPLGILDDVAPVTERTTLRDHDVIVMVSDGIAQDGSRRDEKWLCQAVSLFDAPDPQDIADAILREAQQREGCVPDDLTVIVARVCCPY